MPRIKLRTLAKKYGPFEGPLTREQLANVPHEMLSCILNIHAPCDGAMYGSIGYHVVDVLERYISTTPMPNNLHVFDIWFGNELKNP